VADRRIHLAVALSGRWLALCVRDHGPGLPPRAIRRLFRPFSKSAHDAAHSAPGVGLGLALSRRLARALGGDLRLEENGPSGACFVLMLPVA
jgi:signal transduction histidine kinase